MPTSATRLRNSEVLVLFRRSRASLCWTTGCSTTWTALAMRPPPPSPRLTRAGCARSIPAPRMRRYVLRRLLPGDIAEILVYQTGSESSTVQKKQIQQIRAELGLDRPVLVQYGHWMWDALRGDFGQSYSQRRPVSAILAERFPRSMELAGLTLFLAVIWAVPLGVISAVRQNTWVDYAARIVSLSGLSFPLFVT